MASNINVQLAGATLQIIDNTASTQRINSQITTIVAQAAAAFYDPYMLVPNGTPLSLTLPGTTVWTVMIRNISSSNNISITMTPAGGAAWASPYVLVPGGLFYTSATYSSNPSAGGFTSLVVQASATSTYAEVLLAA